ncbi:MAG: response regulator transcription factor [Dehalococcoidales bacterium]|nr:MAG: response regulator transcription factor [Dehalococcoidales bacterium]
MKALIIEDDINVAEAVSLCFQLRWPDINLHHVINGGDGISALNSKTFDIVILDINLPDMSGFDVLQTIRSFSSVPVIILTVREKEEEEVHGLEIGADDYIVKPFKPRDLIARVNSVLRRVNLSKVSIQSPVLAKGKVSLNLSRNEVNINDMTQKLTPNEAQILYTLMNNSGNIISSEEISQAVWGKDFDDNNRIRTYIRRLRLKLNDNPPRIIRSKRGKGYSFFSPG